jgi:hypothetical protein
LEGDLALLFVETRCGGTCSAWPYSDCIWCRHRRKRGHTYARAELASTKWGENRELRAALLDQSAKAWWGLMVIAVGTGMQVVGTIILLVKD